MATLEILVNAGPDLFEIRHVWFEVDIPEDVAVEEVTADRLVDGWDDHPVPRETQTLGNDWVARGSSAVLLVPSAVLPEERNCLLNPKHPELARLQISTSKWMRFDPRLRNR